MISTEGLTPASHRWMQANGKQATGVLVDSCDIVTGDAQLDVTDGCSAIYISDNVGIRVLHFQGYRFLMFLLSSGQLMVQLGSANASAIFVDSWDL